MKVLDLFSGIGGFSLGLERAGMETVAFCEIEAYPCKVLAKHWPGVPIYNDVRELTSDRLKQDGITVDVITGGFPCQDISVAGKQAGIEGERSGLWSEVARLIDEIQPRYAIMENVTALISGDRGRWFGRVLGDLAEIGYDAEWHCIPASELGAHHHRDRVWILAYPRPKGLQQRWGRTDAVEEGELARGVFRDGLPKKQEAQGEVLADPFSHRSQNKRNESFSKAEEIPPVECNGSALADTLSQRQQGSGELVEPLFAKAIENWKTIDAESGCISGIWEVEPDVGRVANGVPNRSHRLKSLGNAVVPQIPEIIGRAIMAADGLSNAG